MIKEISYHYVSYPGVRYVSPYCTVTSNTVKSEQLSYIAQQEQEAIVSGENL